MLTKRRFLISTLLTTLLMNNLSAQVNDCPNCKVEIPKMGHSKNIKQFKSLNIDKHQLRVTHAIEGVETYAFGHQTYIKQEHEVLTPETEEEKNTIIFAPSTYVNLMSPQDFEKYKRQSKESGMESEEIEIKKIFKAKLPVSLYYCKNDSEPVYNEKLEKFQCYT